MKDREVVEDTIKICDICDIDVSEIFSGTIEEVIDNVTREFSNIRERLDENYNVIGDIIFDRIEHVSFKRLETDPEYNKRIKKEQKKAEAAKKRRKAKFEALLKNDKDT